MQIPQEALYKKNVLVVRGRFQPFTLLHNDMLLGAASQFFCDDSVNPTNDSYDECVFRDDTLVLLEMTTRDMMEVHICSNAGAVMLALRSSVPVPAPKHTTARI